MTPIDGPKNLDMISQVPGHFNLRRRRKLGSIGHFAASKIGFDWQNGCRFAGDSRSHRDGSVWPFCRLPVRFGPVLIDKPLKKLRKLGLIGHRKANQARTIELSKNTVVVPFAVTTALQCVVRTGPAGPIASDFSPIFVPSESLGECSENRTEVRANGYARPNHALKCGGHGKRDYDQVHVAKQRPQRLSGVRSLSIRRLSFVPTLRCGNAAPRARSTIGRPRLFRLSDVRSLFPYNPPGGLSAGGSSRGGAGALTFFLTSFNLFSTSAILASFGKFFWIF